MMRFKFRATLLVFLVLIPSLVTAKGVRVTPVIQEIKLDKDQNEGIYTVLYTNSSEQTQELSLQVADFGSLDESGGIAFIGADTSQLSSAYGLTSWIELSSDSVILPAKETRSVRVKVGNKDSLSPGGHYAALIATVKHDSNDGPNQVQISQKVASLLFLTKTGGEVYSLEVSSWNSNEAVWRLPDQANLRFLNKGNTHTTPRGYVEVVDPLRRVIRRGVVNEGSAMVLPETTRSFSVALKDVRKALVPGKYITKLSYRFDGQDSFATVESSQLILLPATLLFAVLILFILGCTVYGCRKLIITLRRYTTHKKL